MSYTSMIITEILEDMSQRSGLGDALQDLSVVDLEAIRNEWITLFSQYHNVDCLLEDIQERSGLGDEWDQIDEDVQDEIIETWQEIIDNYN